MFESIKNKVNQLINPQEQNAVAPETLALLDTIVEPLAEVDAALPNQALNYIVNGKNPEFLLNLKQQATDQICALLGSSGTYGWFWPSTDLTHTQRKLCKASQNARYKLYINIFSTLNSEQIVRYGKFLEAATQQRNYSQLSKQTPVWFGYILVDGLLSSFKHQHFDDKQRKSHRETWSLTGLKQLYLSEAENNIESFIATLFERGGVNSYHYGELDLLFKLNDSIQFFTEHAQQLQEVLPKLSATAQVIFLDFIAQQQELLKQQAELIILLALSPSKTVREQATVLLTQLDEIESQQHLRHFLMSGDSKQRSYAADLLARLGEQNLEILQQAAENEKLKSVQSNIIAALQRLESLGKVVETDYALPEVEIIEAKEIPESFATVLQENYLALREKYRQVAEQEIEDNKAVEKGGYKSHWRQNNYRDFCKSYDKVENVGKLILGHLNGQKNYRSYIEEIANYQKKLQQLPEFSLIHAARLVLGHGNNDWMNWYQFFQFLDAKDWQSIELRQLAKVLIDVGLTEESSKRCIANEYLENYSGEELNTRICEDEQIIPFFLENIDFIAEALGLLPSKNKNQWRYYDPIKALALLQRFPQVPKPFIPRLLEFALGDSKRLRFNAQEVLRKLPDIHLRAIEALTNGKQEIRVTAVEWLARLQHQAAVPALYDLLKKEKKEVVIAAVLTALEQLGEDISIYLSPENLLKDAEKGLKGKIASSFTWFDLKHLPQVQWKDGSTVNPQIIRWWVILADKLKDPVPNALLQRYMELLNEKSQQALSLHLLQSFIYQDTRNPTLEEAMEFAAKEAPNRLQQYQIYWQDYGKKYPEYYGRYEHITLDEVVEEIKRERLAIYLGSAIKNKGMLALTFKTQGSIAVKLLQDYMKQHYQRRAQIEAMLSSFSVSDDPLMIQLLLSVSRRYRTASVQNLAKQLVEQIAERNHWSSDELADRTIPTAGLDDTGILTLEYGSRILTAYVDDKDKFVLKNEDGKIIKALPAARQGDDESLIKEAKSLFSSSKKEFKQVIDLQTQRLYEAMCSERTWSSVDWQEYLFAHPIMKRLIQGLVWLEISSEGTVLQSFRPSDDGSLLNLEDDEIELAQDSQIKVAHGVLISAEDAEAWQAHFKDYKVKFLFEQMTHQLPVFAAHAEIIEDRKGWLTDTFTLRGVITKLGYQRASIEDGGSFDSYFKPFSQIGLSAVIRFSGSYVPEENLAAVLYDLSFENKNVRSWRDSGMKLTDVPPVLLAETYADYLKVAEACSGFDPEWQKKTPW
ncbi:DUF4132 domain-containing protein [Acinetobacter suaedae]|uniref:DUF4132 domain-containing protein n=1 Tax=Acinetobacter suaedae TaxID=2609668 RepID=A0A5P1UWU6_9GAMM|nr:DUF4132 domain-containing protein [Acinetobacter sp. C16S1]QER40077.1 DUF4132 domain-containing protein [Acinetobacter sp. C16S1]